MKLQFKRGATARQIAVTHRRLAEARLAILEAASTGRHSLIDGPCPLKVTSQDALVRMSNGLRDALYGMESLFMSATGDATAPFANPTHPRAWLDWLESRGDE